MTLERRIATCDQMVTGRSEVTSLISEETSSAMAVPCVANPDNVHETVRHYSLIPLTVLILISNIAVLLLLAMHRHFRRPDLMLIASLCCADILVGASAIASIITRAKESTLDGCLIRVGLSMTAVQTSILTLLAIAVDRLLAIVLHVRYTNVVTVRGTLACLLALWGLAIVCGLFPYLGWNLGPDRYHGYCSFLLVLPPAFVASSFIFSLIPIAAILLIHLYLYAMARAHIRKIDALERVLGRHSRKSGGGALGMSGRSWRSVRTVSCVAGCVLACWCPFLLACLYALLARPPPPSGPGPNPAACALLPEVIGTHLLVLGYLNSALNPVVYALRNQELRLAARRAYIRMCIRDKPRDLNLVPAAL